MIDTLFGIVDRGRDIFPFKIWQLIENLVKTESSREQV